MRRFFWRNDSDFSQGHTPTPHIGVAVPNGKKDNHSWFVAFAPYDQPKIALAVMVEGGKSGGGVAAPIASEIIGKIFALDHGYDPGLKPLDPAVGNYKLVKLLPVTCEFDITSVAAGRRLEEMPP